jgi:hypothetical protein
MRLIISAGARAVCGQALPLLSSPRSLDLTAFSHDSSGGCSTRHCSLWSPWTCTALQVGLGDLTIASTSLFLPRPVCGVSRVMVSWNGAILCLPSSFRASSSGLRFHVRPVTVRFRKLSPSLSCRQKSSCQAGVRQSISLSVTESSVVRTLCGTATCTRKYGQLIDD